MQTLKTINFIKPDPEVWGFLCYAWGCGFEHEQVADHLKKERQLYLPKDQWDLFTKLIDSQTALEIGSRKDER